MMDIEVMVMPGKVTVKDTYTELIKILSDPAIDAVVLPELYMHNESMWFFIQDAVIKVAIENEPPPKHVKIEIITTLRKTPWMVGMVISALKQIGIDINNEVFTWVGKW